MPRENARRASRYEPQQLDVKRIAGHSDPGILRAATRCQAGPKMPKTSGAGQVRRLRGSPADRVLPGGPSPHTGLPGRRARSDIPGRTRNVGSAWADGARVAGQDVVELAAGGDADLGEDLAQVVLDRARADEQPGADLRVGQPLPRQPRDLGLLSGQRVTGLAGPHAGPLDARADGLAASQPCSSGPP